MPPGKFASANESEALPRSGSDVSAIWNFCAHCPGIISRGNQLWHREMLAVFSGYPITIFFWKLKILNLSSHTVGMKLQCINAAINSKIQYDGPANFICGEFSCPANLSFCQFSFFFLIFNYQAFHKTLRKGLIQILPGGDYWGNFNYCNHIATGHMDIATVLQY